MAHITRLAVRRTYTLIKAHLVPPSTFGFPGTTLARAELEDRLAEALAGKPNNPRFPMGPPEMFDYERKRERKDAVQFLSLKEYREEAADAAEREIRLRFSATVQSDGNWGYEFRFRP